MLEPRFLNRPRGLVAPARVQVPRPDVSLFFRRFVARRDAPAVMNPIVRRPTVADQSRPAGGSLTGALGLTDRGPRILAAETGFRREIIRNESRRRNRKQK
jgi:hypothetical protein